MEENRSYIKGFFPYALSAFLISIVGGFSAVLGPAFVQDMGIAYNNTTWTALAQAMSTAACAPILGKLGDVLGRRFTLLVGIIVYTLGNALAALAPSLTVMLIARFIVGVGSAAVAPVVLSYIITDFPPHAVARGFSIYMLISSTSVIFGPALSGLIISAYGWRAMVWVCVAICVAVFIPCALIKDKHAPPRRRLDHFDAAGAALVLIFFSLVLCIPSFGQNFGWGSSAFLGVLIAALIALFALVLAERRAVHPILPGSFMCRRVFILSVLALTLTQGLMQANMTNTIVFVSYTQPDNNVISAYAISVMYLGMSLGAVFLGPLADRFEPRAVLSVSLLLTGISCALLLLFTADASVLLLMSALGLLGFGLGGNGTIFMKVALSDLPGSQAGAATGTYGLFRDLAAPFGVAVFVPLFTNQITGYMAKGLTGADAAVRSIHSLAMIEIFCAAAGIAVVLMLPRIHQKTGNQERRNHHAAQR
ncbi:MAG: MFS transporter [Clostridia bacterium]|nr:MFS transporter [Clostridia bacterium]MBQ6858390.1 MFS transporter [Clostridia bacterium]